MGGVLTVCPLLQVSQLGSISTRSPPRTSFRTRRWSRSGLVGRPGCGKEAGQVLQWQKRALSREVPSATSTIWEAQKDPIAAPIAEAAPWLHGPSGHQRVLLGRKPLLCLEQGQAPKKHTLTRPQGWGGPAVSRGQVATAADCGGRGRGGDLGALPPPSLPLPACPGCSAR